MEGQQIITCPKCGGNKMSPVPLWLVFLISGSCLLWIPIVGWVLAPIFLIAAAVMPLLPKGGIFIRCNDCKHTFPVKKDKYKEYKEYTK